MGRAFPASLRAAALALRAAPRLSIYASTRAAPAAPSSASRLELFAPRCASASSAPLAATPPCRASSTTTTTSTAAAAASASAPGPSLPPHEVYRNPRRLGSAGLTSLAVLQAGFWGASTALSSQVAAPLLPPMYTALGFCLSAAFAAMIATYLRRSVAHLALLNGPAVRVRVVAHGLAGALSAPALVDPRRIRPGPHADDPAQRYWTFGVEDAAGKTRFYIVDTKAGVLDREAVAALVRGGDHLLAWSVQRDAKRMKDRWRDWKEEADKRSPTAT